MKIQFDKENDKKTVDNNYKNNINSKNSIEKMNDEINHICNDLFEPTWQFDEKETFDRIYRYVKEHDRVLYSVISNYVFQSSSDEVFSICQTNIDKILKYIDSDEHIQECNKLRGNDKIKMIKTEKVIIKIYDHVNLAKRQFTELKLTEEDFKKKFENNISPFKAEFTKDMNAQLITLVSIFTALAFLLFGGISSLDNIFEKIDSVPVLKIVISASAWGLGIVNLIFVFILCISKMTKLSFAECKDENANFIKKYPVICWTNIIIGFVLLISSWLYFIGECNADKWIRQFIENYQEYSLLIGLVIITIIFIECASTILYMTDENKKVDKHIENKLSRFVMELVLIVIIIMIASGIKTNSNDDMTKTNNKKIQEEYKEKVTEKP